jgi:tRNA pseudouridine55 synthase
MNRIINLNKPLGITSHQAVAMVRRLLGVKKAGHAGTLDPDACGVLLVCINEATKITRFLMDMEKQYRAEVKIGERTDTFDASGKIIETKSIAGVSEADLHHTVRTFVGPVIQKAPMYSAVKIGGETLYKLARKGIEIDRPDRTVYIQNIEITSVNLPFFQMTIACSKGTYIRSLCEDIGLKLGTGAHMSGLERTAVGSFHLGNAVSFDDLSEKEFISFSVDEVLNNLPQVTLTGNDYQQAKNGVRIISDSYRRFDGAFIRMKDPEGKLFAIGRVEIDTLKINRILHL